MNELQRKIQAVIDRLQGMNIISNFETMVALVLSMQELADVRDKLKEVKPDGNADIQ